jgi:hypothetical protein
MMDPLSKLALARAQAAAADIEAQLSIESGQRPIVVMLAMAKRDAASAIAALTTVDPESAKEIRGLQNQVARFTDICRWLQDVISAGREAEQQITADDREEMIEVLGQTPEGQLELINLGLLEGDTHG